jgi:hypothetical protein
VERPEDREAAVRIARQTEGVTHVENLPRVTRETAATSERSVPGNAGGGPETPDEPLEPPDFWITTKIQAKYFLDPAPAPSGGPVEQHSVHAKHRYDCYLLGFQVRCSSELALYRSAFQDFQNGDRRGQNDRPKHDSGRAERDETTNDGDKHGQRVQAHLLADENRMEQIIDEPHNG